ncbi:trypsin-like peptidase domain-containing protein [Magnetovirga frankeli]|uniref:trypsin-like peptidase domain-containing protein n=1 Tax=Magnetovirga frankeli TaxID=947516 RepID=UPI00029D06E7|nr:magnetosome protein [gamma proteobacterium SS-5]QFY89630.1 trypsin-like peptidase domain-containing protein [gamma proteobacterium SS-5]
MQLNLGTFGTADHCGKNTRKYLYVMAGMALFILLATYGYEYHYLPKNQKQQTLAAVNQPAGQALAFTAPPAMQAPPAGGAAQAVAFQGNPSMMLPVDRPPPRPQFQDAVNALKGSIVSVTASSTRLAAGQVAALGQTGPRFAAPSNGSSSERMGSGVILSQRGHIVTNHHLVRQSTGLMVGLFTDQGLRQHRAEIIKVDPTQNLALLKINPEGPTRPAPLGDSSKIQVADSVITLGNPFGLELSVSRGIVSGMRRAITIGGVVHDQLIQTDAAINQGNSGGALLNRAGEVIGINTAIYTPTGAFAGIGFAIPINRVKAFIQDAVRLTDMAQGQGNAMQQLAPLPINLTGSATGARGPMQNIAAPQGPPIRANAMPPASHSDGRERMACATCHRIQPNGANNPVGPPPQTPSSQALRTQPVVAQNHSLYLEGAVLDPLSDLLVSRINAQVSDGAFISTVYPGTAAEQAGLQAGDIVFKLNGRWVLTPDELLARVAEYRVGDNLRLGVYRGTERLNLNLVLSGQLEQANPRAPAQTAQPLLEELRWIGMELKPITPELMAKKPELQGKKGSLAGDVGPGSLAERFGMQKGDIIRRINGTPVNDMLELERAINAARLNQGVLLLLERNGRAIYLTIRQ